MAAYAYRGRDAALELVVGMVEGESATAVVQELQGRGIVVTHVDAVDAVDAVAPAQTPWWQKIDLRLRRIRDEDVILFSRQMYTLQRANVPILRALAGLQESAANPAFAEVVADVRGSLEQGRELSAAMARHASVFSPFYLAMVRVGEVSGRLMEVFQRLFVHLETERDVLEQVRAALRYPMLVIGAVGVALAVLNLFVIPVFAGVYATLHAQLPLMTRVLIGISQFSVSWWPAILAALVVSAFAVRSALDTREGLYWWDRRKLRLPLVGDIILKGTLARFARGFAMASQSGIPVIEALTVVARTADNAYIAREIENMRDGIERGRTLYRCAQESGVFTPVVLQMIAVGEETGEIDSLLIEIAGMYEREIAYGIKRLSTKVEPILLLLIGTMVLVLALGIFLPMWSLGAAAMGRS
jgi:Type II secretory pathway, component PulF